MHDTHPQQQSTSYRQKHANKPFTPHSMHRIEYKCPIPMGCGCALLSWQIMSN